jgi:hypothetical protein
VSGCAGKAVNLERNLVTSPTHGNHDKGVPVERCWAQALAGTVAGIVVVTVVVVMVMRVITGRGSALTGRRGRHSAAGLAVVATAILSVAHLDEIVRDHHP